MSTVPGLIWSVQQSPTEDAYVGKELSIRCIGHLSISKGIRAIADILYNGNLIPIGREEERVRAYNFQQTSSPYEARLEFTALSEEDEGHYQCIGSVMPTIPRLYVIPSREIVPFDIVLSRKSISESV